MFFVYFVGKRTLDDENVATEISSLGEATVERKEVFHRENCRSIRHFVFRSDEYGELGVERVSAFGTFCPRVCCLRIGDRNGFVVV